MNAPNTTMGAREWAMLLTLSLIWGGAFFFAAVAVTELPPFTVVFGRVGLAAIILLITLKIMGISMPKSPEVWQAFFIMGLLNNVIPFSALFWAQTELASGLASILNAMTPIFTVLAAHVLTSDERLTKGRLAGVVLGFLGVAILIGDPGEGGPIWAFALALGAAASYALASIFGKRFQRLGVSPMATAAGQVSASALWMIPIMCVVDQPWTLSVPGIEVTLSMLGLAVISTAFAYLLFFRILAAAGATNIALVTFLIPPSAIFLGVVFLGEVLALNQIFGALVIAAGLAAIDGRIWGLLRRK